MPVSGVENAAYYYSSYNAPDTTEASDRRKIMVLGGGPNRIGQGIEFDYCCVHAAFAIRDEGLESIMVNCNPETVSTDYDTSDKLYFEPLTVEDVLSIYEKEKPEGVIVQFGGQTPLNIARELAEAGVKILGTSHESIELAEDRDRFRQMMRKLGIPQPDSGMASTFDEALTIASEIGYPLMVRPSFVLGGRAMEVVHDEQELRRYLAAAVEVSPDRPVLIDKFLENAIEVEADAIADGEDAFVPAVMEHIELAGVHSGDSACVIPPISIPPKHIDTIHQYNRKIAIEFNVVGLMNIQYAIYQDTVYVLEANPRASRTVPLVSKVCSIPMARIATQVMLGKKLSELGLGRKSIPHFGVKEAVFPFNMYHEVDPLLGPEMRSTGEVLGLADSFGLAFYKAQQATQVRLPAEGTVLISVADPDKPAVVEVARRFDEMGFTIKATEGTRNCLAAAGIEAEPILKMHEGRPEHRGCDFRRRNPTGDQHAQRQGEQAGRLLHPQDGGQAKGPLHHDAWLPGWPLPKALTPSAKAVARSRACRNTTPVFAEVGLPPADRQGFVAIEEKVGALLVRGIRRVLAAAASLISGCSILAAVAVPPKLGESQIRHAAGERTTRQPDRRPRSSRLPDPSESPG